MITVNDRHADAQAEYNASQLTLEKIRRGALRCILSGTTPETLRTDLVATCPDLAPVWRAWADEVEALTACGVTGRSAREAAKIALVMDDATAADFRRPGVYPDMPVVRSWVGMVADEMDALLAEGFDPDIFEKEIEQACGGAR